MNAELENALLMLPVFTNGDAFVAKEFVLIGVADLSSAAEVSPTSKN